MKIIEENYQRLKGNKDRSFDIHYWQSQGDLAIFKAASEMIRDYLLIKGKNADELRIQRTFESFQKI